MDHLRLTLLATPPYVTLLLQPELHLLLKYSLNAVTSGYTFLISDTPSVR